MYKNALKEDFIRVVEKLNGTVENTDTIVKLKTKIENSSTFESDPYFVKTLIQNCIDERVSRNKREVTSGKQKIELAKLQLAHLSVGTAISPTLTEEFIIHPSVYSEIEKLGHAKSDVLLSESGSSLSADLGVQFNSSVSFPNVSVSNVIKNCSYDLPYVKNFNTRNDSSSLIKDYKCNKIKITKLKVSIVREKCSDIVLCKKANGAMKTSSVEFIFRSPNPSPMNSKYRRFVLLQRIFQPWQWKRRKKRNRFEQTSRTLQRKISMRSTKDQLVEKRCSYAGETQCFPVEPSGCRRDAFT
ncbi:phosphatase and actin regulator 2 [Trichonephila clavipes]|nr:phosphatase and actin regulator 2 [Trichonephila clavipes]